MLKQPPNFVKRTNMTRIVYKTRDFVIVNKPCGIPSQADTSGDDDAMKQCAAQLSAMGEKNELHVINRLDRVVGGLMLFARSRESAAELSELISDKVTKEYRAVVEGCPGEGEMRDHICKDSLLGKARVMKEPRAGAKEAVLEYKTLATAEKSGRSLSLVSVNLKTGRFHQIRAQFSSRMMPLVGDKKYGSRDFGAQHPALFASRLAFRYKNEEIDVRISPDGDAYPWSLFDKKLLR